MENPKFKLKKKKNWDHNPPNLPLVAPPIAVVVNINIGFVFLNY